MSSLPTDPNLQTLKINCHDPRCHQAFLQLSNDMHRWKLHANDSSWWMEREKSCLALFQQYGYELQSGVWYCLILCQRSGLKGAASASLLLADGFAKQQKPCWPPLAAQDLRRQMLEGYCSQILPLVYALPMTALSASSLQQMHIAVETLQRHAASLNSPTQFTLQQFCIWLKANLKTLEQEVPAILPSPDSTPYPPLTLSEQTTYAPVHWRARLTWIVIGAAAALACVGIFQQVTKPDILLASNRLWPGNPIFVHWERRLNNESATLKAASSWDQFNQQLSSLEQRLLDAEQKRKPYVTISELKTAIYQMRETLRFQEATVENRLYRLQQHRNDHTPVSEAELHAIASQLNALNNRLLLLSHET